MNKNNIVNNESQITKIEKVDLIETQKADSWFGFNLLTIVVVLVVIFVIMKVIKRNRIKNEIKN